MSGLDTKGLYIPLLMLFIGEVYAWTAVLILPLNSAINPLIYTIAHIKAKQKQKTAKLQQRSNTIPSYVGKSNNGEHQQNLSLICNF